LVAAGGRVVAESHSPARLGILAGQIELADDFDEPLPEFEPYTT
jgi:hypothetical protein